MVVLHMSSSIKALAWFMLGVLSSCCNDVLAKYLSDSFTYWQICGFRFFLGSLVLLPFMFYNFGFKWFQGTKLTLHFSRGLLLVMAMALHVYGLHKKNISTITLIGFTNPIFLLILAKIFLKEPIDWPIWLATFLAGLGIACTIKLTDVTCNMPVLACLLSALIFSSLEIINKSYIKQEHILNMLFFSNAFAMLCVAFPVCYNWKTPTLSQCILFIFLGIGSNGVLFFVLKAFQLSDVSFLVPFRYIEFLISSLLGYVCFGELPEFSTCLGAGLIILATSFVLYYKRHNF